MRHYFTQFGRYFSWPLIGISLALVSPSLSATTYTGKLVDANSGAALVNATITTTDNVVYTDAQGQFNLSSQGKWIGFRAPGYLRSAQYTQQFTNGAIIKLIPFEPRALYLSFHGIGSNLLRGRALDLIEQTELNALVVDIKGDRGMISMRIDHPQAKAIGAQQVITIKEAKALVDDMHRRGIYMIARIVSFKDNLLAEAKPQLAIRDRAGNLFRDREKLAWVDPSRKETWDYIGDIAIEAAKAGFDEIQFDYVRFPDTKGLSFSVENTQDNRVKYITGFLNEMRKRLTPYNVYISADIFGYVIWNTNDTHIGQQLEHLNGTVDYLAPMLYPSGFQFGLPGVRNPVADSYNIVYQSLMKAQARTGLPGVRFRPWLQAFRDYAFDRRQFTEREIADQIRAATNSGSHGYMLWNPRNAYSTAGLKRAPSRARHDTTSNGQQASEHPAQPGRHPRDG